MQIVAPLLIAMAAVTGAQVHKRTSGNAPDVFDMFDGGNLEGGMVGGVEGEVAGRVNILHGDDRMLRNNGDGLETVSYNATATKLNGAVWIYNPSWKLFLNSLNNELSCLDAFKGDDGQLYVHTYACAKWNPDASEATQDNQIWDADPLANFTTIAHAAHTGFCLSQSGWENARMAPCNTSDPAQLFELRDSPK
ncbi:hypothetical protein ACHHYP_11644 [Achlya hypogyna]|uniref:Secreted protein n=1 Tax=Achlya hypogyna TaxID=1202772 RepID=A0A0A7CPD0_ACHHY|nr:secreted protein [Achlya hypogyna]OQR85581.1 hypothetical protein ACHHYP_11644 [Achlya hypogyna]